MAYASAIVRDKGIAEDPMYFHLSYICTMLSFDLRRARVVAKCFGGDSRGRGLAACGLALLVLAVRCSHHRSVVDLLAHFFRVRG